MPSPSVLIVGAGPVGLTTALALHQGGIPAGDILVVDRRPSRDLPTNWSKALSVNASTLEVFRTLGIAERFIDAGLPVGRMHFGGGDTFLTINYDVIGTKYPHSMIIPQTRTESILMQRCEEVGISFAWGRLFVAFTQTAEEVLATFQVTGEGAEVTHTPWLIGCDGTGSAVRQTAGIAWEGTKATRWSWLADGYADEDAPTMENRRTDSGRAMIFATGDGKTGRRFIGIYPPSEPAPGQRLPEPDLDFLRNWAVRNFGSHYNFHNVTWTSVVGDGMRLADSYRSGRVFVVGDAAHQLFPASGQGMNTGLLDATNLAWKLAMVVTGKTGTDGEIVERVLDSYCAERRAAAQAVRHNVHMQMATLYASTERERAVSDFIAEALHEPALNKRWARRFSGFADPVEPYQLLGAGQEEVEELVGSRVTHIADLASDEILHASRHNVFVVGFMTGSLSTDEQRSSIEQAVQSSNLSGKVRVIGKLLEPTSPRWQGVIAVLIRPDLRVACVAREGSDVTVEERFTEAITWWLGGK